MIRLERLYVEAEGESYFSPITFQSGLNIILGEQSQGDFDNDQKKKMNGVGKSLIIEIIDFCLLNDVRKSRLSKLPLDLSSDKDYFCLDFTVTLGRETFQITIKRSRMALGSEVIIITNGEEVKYTNLNDARLYLETFFVLKVSTESPSLRQLLSIIIRKEDTLYGDLFYTNSESKKYNYSDLIKPHMYLFGVDLEIIQSIKQMKIDLKKVKTLLSSVRNDFKLMNVTERDIKSHINDLQDRVVTLSNAIQTLEPNEVIESKKVELIGIQEELNRLTTEKTGRELFLKKIESMPKVDEVDVSQMQVVYDNYKTGLGEIVAQSFNEVLSFRKEVERYQQQLAVNKQKEIKAEISELAYRISQLRAKASAIYKLFKVSEKLDDFSKAVEIQQSNKRDLDLLSTKYEYFVSKKTKKQDIERALVDLFDKLDIAIINLQKVVNSFEKDLMKLHEKITGNRKCQFELTLNPQSEKYVQSNFRIDLDGSAGIDRLATFMYDFLLMTNDYTKARHPGFLIQDNIFPLTSRDDMVKSLNYVHEAESAHNFQYILTLNKDEFEAKVDELTFDYNQKTVKVLTRQNKLFGRDYSEIRG